MGDWYGVVWLSCWLIAYSCAQTFPGSDDLEFPHPVRSDDTCGTPPEIYFDPEDNVNLTCNASNAAFAHPPENAVDNDDQTWWQSKKGVDTVQFELNLTQMFELVFLFFEFGHSYRPRGIAIEKSVDYGVTFDPVEYIVLDSSTDCDALFNVSPVANFFGLTDPGTVLCREFSGSNDKTSGDFLSVRILRDPVNLRRPGQNPLDSALLDFMRANYLRITMKKFQPIAISSNADFFSIAELKVNGRCVCNGHASSCTIGSTGSYTCDCQDNTCGSSCEMCCPLFNQQQYQTAITSSFECEECECNGQAMSCVYDSTVAANNQSRNTAGVFSGGGVCNCQNSTAGINCECSDICIGQLELLISDAQGLLTSVSTSFDSQMTALETVEHLLSTLANNIAKEKTNIADVLMALQQLEPNITRLEMSVESLLNRTCHLLDKVKALQLRAEMAYNHTRDRLAVVTNIHADTDAALGLVQDVHTRIGGIRAEVLQRRTNAENLVNMTKSLLTNFTRNYNASEMRIDDIRQMADAARVIAISMYQNATAFTTSLGTFEMSLTELEQLENSINAEAAVALSIAMDVLRVSQLAGQILDKVDNLDVNITATLRAAEMVINDTVAKNTQMYALLQMTIDTFMAANGTLSGSHGITYQLAQLHNQFTTFSANLDAVEVRVNRSVDHAYGLMMLAMETERIFNSSRARGSAAVDVVHNYEDVTHIIVQAVQDAEHAMSTADQTLQHVQNLTKQDLEDKARFAYLKSREVLARARAINVTAHELVTVKTEAQQSVHSASHYFMLAQEANLNVSRAIRDLPDVYPTMRTVRDNVACVQNSVAQCEGMHAAIESRIDRQRMILSNAEDIARQANGTFDDAYKTLSNATIELANRLAEIDTVTSRRNETVTLREHVKSEIMRIRDKLNIVRSLASRCRRKLVFSDNSGTVQYKLRNETDDGVDVSSRFTIASFYFLPRNDSGLLLYIGNHVNSTMSTVSFFAVEMVASHVWLKFSTGSSGVAVKHYLTISGDEWYYVHATRHYTHGALTVTGPDGNSSTVYGSEPSASATGMLSLAMPIGLFGGSDLLAVQQHSSVISDDYVGSLDAIVINRHTVSIADLQFNSVVNVSNCPDRNVTVAPSLSAFFYGNGFLVLDRPNAVIAMQLAHVSMRFSTDQRNAQLLLITNDHQDTFLSISIYNHHPMIMWGCGKYECVGITLLTDVTVSNAPINWYDLVVNVTAKNGFCRMDANVNGDTVSGFQLGTADLSTLNQNLFIGGLPDSFNSSSGALNMFFTHLPGYMGCMRDVTFGNPSPLYLTSATDHLNVDFEVPCDLERVEGVSFKGMGYAALAGPHGNNTLQSISVFMVAHERDGVLFYTESRRLGMVDYFYVAIFHGNMIVQSRIGGKLYKLVTSAANLHNGFLHSVAWTLSTTKIQLIVDGAITSKTASSIAPFYLTDTIYVGGIPQDVLNSTGLNLIPDMPVTNGFIGCLQEVVLNNEEMVDFADNQVELVNVDLQGCAKAPVAPPVSVTPTPTTLPPFPPPPPPPSSVTPTPSPTRAPPMPPPPPPPPSSVTPTPSPTRLPPPMPPPPFPPATTVLPSEPTASPTPSPSPSPSPSTVVPSSSSVLPSPTPTPTPGPPACAEEAPLMLDDGHTTTFTTNSYFRFDLPTNGFPGTKTELQMDFRTASSEGVLVYIESGQHDDFFGLEIREGRIRLAFDAGSGLAEGTTVGKYNDQQWHTIRVDREKNEANMTVDGETLMANVTGGLTHIGTNRRLYIGGTPDTVDGVAFSPDQLLKGTESTRPSVVACFRILVLNSRTYDFSNPTDSNLVGNCLSLSGGGAFYTGSGYWSYFTSSDRTAFSVESWKPFTNFNISLRFRTYEENGMLFYTDNPAIPDYVQVQLVNGSILFEFDNGDGVGKAMLAVSENNTLTVCDGNWHELVIRKAELVGEIKLDGIHSASGMAPPGRVGVDTYAPLFFGGVPDVIDSAPFVKKDGVKGSETISFRGCIRDWLLVSSFSTRFGRLIPDFGHASVVGKGVEMGGCPFA